MSLLGALLVFLLFVQGGNSMIFSLGRTEDERRMLVNSTGRKWEITFTTLVTFGGAFFASFPLFYSTSFGGAYWLWMIILFSFVLQAVSYEFQNKRGNLLGSRIYRRFLIFNGILGPLLLGCAVATFFTGAEFVVNKDNLVDGMQPVISTWAGAWHGLEALANPWNLVLGMAVFFLARVLGLLYFINNINNEDIRCRASVQLWGSAVPFVFLFVAFLVRTLLADGYAVNAAGAVVLRPMKYLDNLVDMWYLLVMLLAGVAMLLYGIARTLVSSTFIGGIWSAGAGTVLAVLSLLLCAGWGGTAYYPSLVDINSSLTIANSCSSEFTLRTMTVVSLFIPFVAAYIAYAWRALDKKKIDVSDIRSDESY